jgi:hypothetical protein
MSADPWWQPLRYLNDRYFYGQEPGISWRSHLSQLNADYGLQEPHSLTTLPNPDLPPAWFIGDVTRVVPGSWILIISLNPDPDPNVDHYLTSAWDPASFWHFQTTWFQQPKWWNSAFHGPLARLAMTALTQTDEMDEKSFAQTHLVFAELCPYASRGFALPWYKVIELCSDDIGCRVGEDIVDLMVRKGQPRAIFVNGNPSIWNFKAMHRRALTWRDSIYESDSKPGKYIRHKQGLLDIDAEKVPVIGFPFYRRPATHNSQLEQDQLGRHIKTFLSTV